MTYDVFISYRHSRKDEVLTLCTHLTQAGIRYFRDEERRDDDASIQRTIEQGLAKSRLLLAWYDPTYLQSRACAWEFSRALLAAHAGNGGLERIVCVDPSVRFSHIVPEALLDQARQMSLDDPASLVALLRERLEKAVEPLGEVAASDTPGWYERDRPSHPTWVGRAGELIRLFDRLDHGRLGMHGGQRAPVAITGWGGEGKTMLAEQYALRFAAAYPGGIVWLSGATQDGVTPRAGRWQEQLESALTAAAAGKLGLPVNKLVHGMADPVQRIRTLKAAIDRTLQSRVSPDSPPPISPYLWIIDDLPDRLSAQDQQLWLPPSEQAHCIATLREAAGVGSVFHTHAVTSMDETEALEMLTFRRPPASEQELTAARCIAEAVDRLPLALALGAVAVETLGYEAYLDLLQEADSEELDELVQTLGPALPTGHVHSIARTFLRSLDQLPGAQDELASDAQRAAWTVLRLTALLAPVQLPDALAERTLREEGFGEKASVLLKLAVATLHRAALIRREGIQGVDACAMHALMARTVLEVRLDDHERQLLLANVNEVARAWIGSESVRTPVEADARVLDVAQRLCSMAHTQGAAMLAREAGAEAQRRGQYVQAGALLGHAAAELARLLGNEHPYTLTSISNLAETMQAQGELAGARALQQQVLETRRRVLGEEHSDTLGSINNLTVTMLKQGETAGTRALQQQLLETLRRVLGEEHPHTLTSMNNLAGTMRAQGELVGARALDQQVLETRRRVLGEEHPDTLNSMNNLAGMMRAQGELASALALDQQVLETRRRVLGEEHPDTLNSKSNLAVTMRAQGELAGARALQQQVLETRRRVLGEEHPHTLNSMNNLAVTMLKQGELAGARALQQQVLETRRRVLVKDHPDTLNSMSNLAMTMQAQGELDDARALQQQVLETLRRVLGEEHPHTLTSMNNLAMTMQEQGELADASALQQQVLETLRRVLGEKHPHTLTSMNNLAVTMRAKGELDGASALQQQVLATCRQVLSDDHPDTENALWQLYETLLSLRDIDCIQKHEQTIENIGLSMNMTCTDLQRLFAHFDARRAAHDFPPRTTGSSGDEFSAAVLT